MWATQSRQKSYADKRRRPLEFETRDHVFLRVTSTTGVGRAIKSKKLSPKFCRTLRKYVPNATHVLEADDIQVREDLTLDVGPVRALEKQTKNLRGKNIRMVKVLWNEGTQEMTWELEEHMKKEYPYLFRNKNIFEDENF
ncbi:uncharacterized protein LOC124828643 [Vigna umbellata]|uniref:uncharacterized protein LOC124828643 n=1 Tax=Vigna umbellata TaxID=87088 RepID=UPI001F5F0641|nr:uncharacterized protein LOC124828643 [Vigna umbellata]